MRICALLLSLTVMIVGCRAAPPSAAQPAPMPYAERQPSVEVQREPIPVTKQLEGQTDVTQLLMTDAGFEPAEIRTRVGGRVKLHIRNTSRSEHNLVVDRFGIVSRTLRPGEENYVEFTAGAPGDWPMISDVPGLAEPGFTGRLKVE